MRKNSKNWMAKIVRNSRINVAMAFSLLVLTGPSFALTCTHRSAMSKSQLMSCMSVCHNSVDDNASGKTSVSAEPCVKVHAMDAQVWINPQNEEFKGLPDVFAFEVQQVESPLLKATFVLAQRGPPGLRLSAGYPAVPTSHGPPQV